MSIIKKDALETIRLAREVIDLAQGVVDEIDNMASWDHEKRRYVSPENGIALNTATHHGSPATGSLRRRSMDLTRQLAKLRKGDLR